jgi:glycosyltransferase involved in cell wall biosynthesis
VRIVIVNKYLFRRDGVTSVVEETMKLLGERGHMVMAFGQADPRNFTEGIPHATVPPVALDAPDSPARAKLIALARILFGFGVRRRFARFLAEARPDVVHLHNIYHHLGPPIIGILRKRRIPIVMTLHDYKVFCPQYLLWRGERPCAACIARGPFNAVRFRCVRNSETASLVCWLEAILHRRFYAAVDRFCAPSRFMAEVAQQAGIPARKILVVPNPAPAFRPGETPPAGKPPLVLFLGRLYPEKGAETLLRAFARLRSGVANLTIAGEGPERARLEALNTSLGVAAAFPGFVDGSEKTRLLGRAAVVVFPSRWYENGPMTILEAFAAEKAVIASAIGGIPEMVRDGVNGLLVPPGDVKALAKALARLVADPALRAHLGRAARETAAREFSPEAYADRLEQIYRSLR